MTHRVRGQWVFISQGCLLLSQWKFPVWFFLPTFLMQDSVQKHKLDFQFGSIVVRDCYEPHAKKKKENPLFHAIPNSSLISSDFPFCFILCRNLEFNISIKDLKPNCFLYKLPKEPNNRVNVDRASFILTRCITSVTWDSVQGNDKVRCSPTKNILTVTP